MFNTCPFTVPLPPGTIFTPDGPGQLLIPMVLGEPISFSTTASFFVENNAFNDIGGAGVTFHDDVTFNFVEADEVTPVAIIAPVPEPSTWSVVMVSMLFLIAQRLLVRSRDPRTL